MTSKPDCTFLYFKPSGKWMYDGRGVFPPNPIGRGWTPVDRDAIKKANGGELPGVWTGDGLIIVVIPDEDCHHAHAFPRMLIPSDDMLVSYEEDIFIADEGAAPSSDEDKDYAAKFGDALFDSLIHINDDARFQKSKQTFLDGIWDDIQYSIINNMTEALEGLVRDMADKAVDAMLKGQPKEVARYLHLDHWTGRDREHPVIHGRLHENHALQLRRQIVEANADLLQNERIKDLESVVASLERQVVEKDATINGLRERLSVQSNLGI